jgi:hypothetical protein
MLEGANVDFIQKVLRREVNQDKGEAVLTSCGRELKKQSNPNANRKPNRNTKITENRRGERQKCEAN